MISSANRAGLLAVGWRCRSSKCGQEAAKRHLRYGPADGRGSSASASASAWGARRAAGLAGARSGSASTQHSSAALQAGRRSLGRPGARTLEPLAASSSRSRSSTSSSTRVRAPGHLLSLILPHSSPDLARSTLAPVRTGAGLSARPAQRARRQALHALLPCLHLLGARPRNGPSRASHHTGHTTPTASDNRLRTRSPPLIARINLPAHRLYLYPHCAVVSDLPQRAPSETVAPCDALPAPG
jgi:hypothetical protein